MGCWLFVAENLLFSNKRGILSEDIPGLSFVRFVASVSEHKLFRISIKSLLLLNIDTNVQ